MPPGRSGASCSATFSITVQGVGIRARLRMLLPISRIIVFWLRYGASRTPSSRVFDPIPL